MNPPARPAEDSELVSAKQNHYSALCFTNCCVLLLQHHVFYIQFEGLPVIVSMAFAWLEMTFKNVI